MPLYEFRCKACGDFEAWRRLAEIAVPMVCPTCSEVAVRVFSPPSINLNQGSLSAIANSSNTEPRLVKRQEREPGKPRYQGPKGGRPWMIGHAPERL
ncbi:MAG: zinc ribbon domain-containing protein [Synechococcales bacterium]|nr:zinc ribbon domain-containing protein [Synechococcales bacterium]